MLDAHIIKSRGRDMVCLVNFGSQEARGEHVLLYKHGFMGNQTGPHRIVSMLAGRLAQRGITTVRFDCVGAGASEGTCHDTTLEGEMADTLEVVSWIRRELRPKTLTLLGYSMGGCISALIAKGVDADGLILWSPVSNPAHNFFHLLGADLFRRGTDGHDVDFGGDRVGREFFQDLEDPLYSPLRALDGFGKPIRIIHGDGDTDVDVSNGLAYGALAGDVALHVVAGAGHGYDKVEYQEELFEKTEGYVIEIAGRVTC